jgi:hypothetical protein
MRAHTHLQENIRDLKLRPVEVVEELSRKRARVIHHTAWRQSDVAFKEPKVYILEAQQAKHR